MAKKKVRLKGINKVMKELNKQVNKIEGRSMKGLIAGGIIVFREMEPMVPIDQGNLRSSSFMTTARGEVPLPQFNTGSFKGPQAGELSASHTNMINKYKTIAQQGQPMVVIGLSANYAYYVHENVGMTFQRSSAESKFLEKALKKSKTRVLYAIKQEVELK